MALEQANYEKKQLLEHILNIGKPVAVIQSDKPALPVRPQIVPWRVRQQMLEEQDRKNAQLLADKKREEAEINQLEQQTGVNYVAGTEEEKVL